MEDTPGPQFLPQSLQDRRVAKELHDKGSAGTGSGGEGGKD